MPAVKRLKTSHLYRPCLILDTFTSNLLSWREKNVRMHTRSRATATQRSNNGPTRHRHMVSRGYAHWWNNSFLNFSKFSIEQKIYDYHFCVAIDKFRGGVIQLIGKEAFLLFIFPFLWNFMCKNYRFAMPWK